MPDLVMYQEITKHWVRYIHQRIGQNKNFLGFVSGPTGSGKSWSCLRIGQELDPEFNINRVVFSGVELMNLINSGKLHSGSVIIFEEVGIEMSNRNWQSAINKMLNYLMQTFRHRNFILIMNSPYMDFVDAATRKLFHAELRTVSIDHKAKQVKLKPQLIQYNSRYRKFYFKYLRVATKNGVMPVKFWYVDKPDMDLVKDYEAKKGRFTSQLNLKIVSELKRKGLQKPKFRLDDELIYEYLKKGLSTKELAKKFNCTTRSIQLRKKDFKEGKRLKTSRNTGFRPNESPFRMP